MDYLYTVTICAWIADWIF